jgi:hypothetical protein
VTGQVDEVDLAARHRQQREARHDRDAALLLLLEPVYRGSTGRRVRVVYETSLRSRGRA